MTPRQTQPRAYTLLELVLVLAIIATMIAMVAPSLAGFARGRRPEEAARKFVSLTRWARSQAVTDGVTYQLVVDASQGQWKLNVQDDTGTFVYVPGPFGQTFSAPEGVEIQCDLPVVDGQQAITFDPTGRCDTGTLHFIGFGTDITVACDGPVEVYRILKDTGGQS